MKEIDGKRNSSKYLSKEIWIWVLIILRGPVS